MARLVVLLMLVALPAVAADDLEPARSGFYFGVGAVYAAENFSFDSENLGMTAILGPGVDPDYDDSAGAHLQIGYRTHPTLAFEFLYEFLEGFDSTAGSPKTEIDSHLFTFNAKVYPFDGRWQPYLLTGIGARLINSEVFDKSVKKPYETDAGFTARFGGGLAVSVTRHFAVELEGSYQVGTGGIVRHANYGTFAVHFLYRM